jgi:U3 small nucleolar RNA-associated protein 20
MPAMSRGPLAKLRNVKGGKGGTPSSRNHHFESFSQRIAVLKIEPVRRGRNTILDAGELDGGFSYFCEALAEWRDLNLSTVFARFARQVAPLCASLPQLLHHSPRILDLLVEYIETADSHSEEPLLSLLAHFAHDLGANFEPHFERAVKAVSRLAATHQDLQVIEWSFTCLAWLFKYLSRLLVPDLRPVFNLMAPLLGKEHQKAFVTRFASDSLCFLLRKAGAVHHRDQRPLRTIVTHVAEQLKDLQDSGKDREFQQGLMSLFADAIKGVQRGLHSSAVAILQQLLEATYDAQYKHLRTSPLQPVLEGAITAVIHHSDAEHFQPLLETLLANAQKMAADVCCLSISARLLLVACGVRMGARVAHWGPVLETVRLLQDAVEQSSGLDLSASRDYLSLVSIVFQYCPLEAAIPYSRLLENAGRGHWEKHFPLFCYTFAEIGFDRFNTLLLPHLRRYVLRPEAKCKR